MINPLKRMLVRRVHELCTAAGIPFDPAVGRRSIVELLAIIDLLKVGKIHTLRGDQNAK